MDKNRLRRPPVGFGFGTLSIEGAERKRRALAHALSGCQTVAAGSGPELHSCQIEHFRGHFEHFEQNQQFSDSLNRSASGRTALKAPHESLSPEITNPRPTCTVHEFTIAKPWTP